MSVRSEEYANPLIRNFLRGSSSMRFSSENLHWPAAALERHIVLPSERAEGSMDGLLLVLWQGNSVARGEHPRSGDAFVPYAKRPGTLSLFAPGTLPPVRSFTHSDLLLCALDHTFISRVEAESWDEQRTGSSRTNCRIAQDRPSFYDDSLTRLLLLLRDEVKSSGITGSLYAEHLIHALVMRLFTLANSELRQANLNRGSRIASKLLGQILDRIEANPLERLDLTKLAAEYGSSYGRFLRDFRAGTGLSPHRYITRRRLERAKSLMQNRSRTLLEIALDTGFASHAHLSHAFRQHFGCAPSVFRDTLQK